MTWRIGKGKRARKMITDLLIEFDAVVPSQMEIEEINTVTRAKDSLVIAATELQRLSKWGW